jgi:very-short-patch-repair endonuclease
MYDYMMPAIVFPTAAQYWLTDCPNAENDLKDLLNNNNYFDNMQAFGFQNNLRFPLHVAVSNASERHKGPLFICHVIPEKMLAGSFVQVKKNVFIASPELCFLQSAFYLNIPEMAAFACNLCAIYCQSEQNTFGQIRRDPVTSVDKIISFLNKVNNVKGIKKARIAIRYALDRSNSPMESKIAAISQLSISRGGYHLLTPELNGEINLSKEGQKLMKRDTCMSDMVWREQKVIVEYDSNISHLSKQQHFIDKTRITALNLSGYTVISLTARNLESFRSIDETFFTIRSVLGMRGFETQFERYLDKRYDVVKQLFFKRDSLFF